MINSLKHIAHTTAILILLGIILSGCVTGASDSTLAPTHVVGLTPINSQLVTTTPSIPEILTAGCQSASLSNSFLVGGILFYEHNVSKNPITTRVWLWSQNIALPRLILETDFTSSIYLSPDGKKLVWQKNSAWFTVYDLDLKQYDDFPMQPSWQGINGWTSDGRVSINVDYQATFGKGITSTAIYYDIQKRSFTTNILDLELPGYSGDDAVSGPLSGFAAADPTKSLALYTSNEDGVDKLILQEVNSGNVLWKRDAPYALYPYPDWTSDGNKVVFVLYDDRHDNRPVFHLLSRAGKTDEVIGEGVPPRIIRDIKWSLSENYVYYAYWNTVNTGPAFVIDVTKKETKEICTPDFAFLSGHWLPNDQLAYIVQKGMQPDQTSLPGIIELRILDISSWTERTIYQAVTTKGQIGTLNFLGWIPNVNQ
ncbi:MAG: hypothetical protein QM730_02555 [Anaerolineales bacterium]